MRFCLVFLLFAEGVIAEGAGRVIQLEDLVLESKPTGPEILELQASELEQKIERTALRQLIRLEQRLTQPRPLPSIAGGQVGKSPSPATR